MDITTLAATAIILATPFVQKIGEGFSQKIGEDIWDLIKKPFLKRNKEPDISNPEQLKMELIDILTEDEPFKKELEDLIKKYQDQAGSVIQNIQNNDQIEKQVNVGRNIGDIIL